MGVRKTLAAALIGVGAAVASAPALASHIQAFGFNAEPFTFDPTAYCDTLLTCTEFTAKYIDFSYQAEVDQTGNTFDESGFAFFSSFQQDLGDPVLASISGLNVDYKLYATFTSTGTTALNGAGGIDGTFNTFLVGMYIDPNLNTTCSIGTQGGADETTTCAGTGDDVLILSGILNVGGFHLFSGLAAGDFDVLMDVTYYDPSIWGGTAFAGPQVEADMNGVNTQIGGVTAPPSDFTDGHIIGSGNVSFQSVPEPGSLSLIGLGLLALGALMRRRLRRSLAA